MENFRALDCFNAHSGYFIELAIAEVGKNIVMKSNLDLNELGLYIKNSGFDLRLLGHNLDIGFWPIVYLPDEESLNLFKLSFPEDVIYSLIDIKKTLEEIK